MWKSLFSTFSASFFFCCCRLLFELFERVWDFVKRARRCMLTVCRFMPIVNFSLSRWCCCFASLCFVFFTMSIRYAMCTAAAVAAAAILYVRPMLYTCKFHSIIRQIYSCSLSFCPSLSVSISLLATHYFFFIIIMFVLRIHLQNVGNFLFAPFFRCENYLEESNKQTDSQEKDKKEQN